MGQFLGQKKIMNEVHTMGGPDSFGTIYDNFHQVTKIENNFFHQLTKIEKKSSTKVES
jgi:predicted xylose isomerase-like sugar epimerase